MLILKSMSMKVRRTIVRLCFVIAFTACAYVVKAGDRTVSSRDIPTAILDSLYQRFPSVKVRQWVQEDTILVAHFRVNGIATECAFTRHGEWCETETTLRLRDLPKAVRDAWQASAYKSWRVVALSRSTRPTGTEYEIEVRNKQQHLGLHYSEKGVALRTEKE